MGSYRTSASASSDAFRRALEGYDSAFESKLVEHITSATSAIAEASFVDAGDGHRVLALRLGEIAGALTTILAATLALSPAATRTPKAIREISDKVRRKLERQVRQAERDPTICDFKSRTFNETDRDRGGNG